MSLARERFRRGRAVSWTPWNIPRSILAGYWSAADHGTGLMTDDGAGLISAWADRTTGKTVTATTTARPTWSATGFCGAYPALVGDGTANTMAMANTTGLPTGSTPGALLVLGQNTNPAAVGRHAVSYGGAANSHRRLAVLSTGAIVASDGTTAATSSRSWSEPSIGVGYWSGTTEWVRANGLQSADATISSLNTSTTRTRFFSSNTSTAANFWAGPLVEIIILANPTIDLIQRIEGYWAWAYPLAGIVAQLPSEHPFKAGSP
jgi:hypothetical protein